MTRIPGSGCMICNHDDIKEINIALLDGTPQKEICEKYGFKQSLLSQHKSAHLLLDDSVRIERLNTMMDDALFGGKLKVTSVKDYCDIAALRERAHESKCETCEFKLQAGEKRTTLGEAIRVYLEFDSGPLGNIKGGEDEDTRETKDTKEE